MLEKIISLQKHLLTMSKEYESKKEAERAVRKAVGLRSEWEDALRCKATVKELEERGLKTVVINEQ